MNGKKIAKKLEINCCAGSLDLDVKADFTVRCPGLVIWAEIFKE